MTCTSLLFLGLVAVSASPGKILMRSFPLGKLCLCPLKTHQVCGTDGLTYRNFCALNCASKTNKDLKMRYDGPCRSVYDRCQCPLLWLPICGSDGLTYSNMCELLCTAPLVPYVLKPIKAGVCSPWQVTTNDTDSNSTEVTITPTTETTTQDAQTTSQTPTEPDRDPSHEEEEEEEEDPCHLYEKCNKKKCKSEPVSYVCGSNGHTYKNLCRFCCAYRKSPDLTIASNGKCKDGKDGKGKKKTSKDRRPKKPKGKSLVTNNLKT